MRIFTFLLLFASASSALAQPKLTLSGAVNRPSAVPVAPYVPEAGAVLNHTQLMFEYPAVENASSYELIIEEALPGNGNPIWLTVKEHTDRSNAALISGLKFGTRYRWRVIAQGLKGNSLSKSQPLEFSIVASQFADTTRQRVRILRNQVSDSGVVSFDFAHTIYNRLGNAVWVLPEVAGKISDNDIVRDLRITPQGTFTFIAGQSVYETDIDGRILWSGANNKAVRKNSGTDYYHGNLIRTAAGNYLTLGNEAVKTPVSGSDSVIINYPYITEYNWLGQQTWMWSSRNYFKQEDILEIPGNGSVPYSKAFLSSISTDANGQYIYAGFRMLSTVLKIERITGKVIAAYTGQFANQHDVNFLGGDSLLVFNNNGNALLNEGHSSVQLLKVVPGSNELITLWEFDLRKDGGSTRNADRYGNAEMLKSGNVLIGGGSLARVFEVNRHKTIVWEAVTELYDTKSKRWGEFQQSSAHYATSLYPCYFTLREGIRHLGKTPPYFFLANEGTSADSYVYSVNYTKPGETVLTVTPEQTCVADAGKELRIILPVETYTSTTGLAEVRVRSLTNPNFSRKLLVRVN
ncbi:MAG: arylsulfotransferase family protein [Bacteroidia bacterium]